MALRTSRNTKEMITQKYINDIAYKIVGCAIEVHKQLGPGLLEMVPMVTVEFSKLPKS